MRMHGFHGGTRCLHVSIRAAASAAVAVSLLAAAPAQAQFGGLGLSLGKARSAANDQNSTNGCPKGKSKSAGSSLFGSMVGSMAGNAIGRTGFGSFVPLSEFSNVISNAIACKLDPAEQKQAANATIEATRGDAKVGQTASWTSETREKVSGTSTVVARNDADPTNGQCITVNDVVIVNGEETTASKRMCKKPGSARYVLMA